MALLRSAASVTASGMIEKDYTARVATERGRGPNLMLMEHTAATRERAIPSQRHPLLRFTFRVVPRHEAAHDLELWSEDLGDAAERALALAAMAYGPDTAVSLVSDRAPQPVG